MNEVFVDAHRRAVDAIRANAPGVPVGLTLAMVDYQTLEGGEATRDQARATVEDGFRAATVGDDFLGVQTYSRQRFGPGGMLGPETRRGRAPPRLRVLAGGPVRRSSPRR